MVKIESRVTLLILFIVQIIGFPWFLWPNISPMWLTFRQKRTIKTFSINIFHPNKSLLNDYVKKRIDIVFFYSLLFGFVWDKRCQDLFDIMAPFWGSVLNNWTRIICHVIKKSTKMFRHILFKDYFSCTSLKKTL